MKVVRPWTPLSSTLKLEREPVGLPDMAEMGLPPDTVLARVPPTCMKDQGRPGRAEAKLAADLDVPVYDPAFG